MENIHATLPDLSACTHCNTATISVSCAMSSQYRPQEAMLFSGAAWKLCESTAAARCAAVQHRCCTSAHHASGPVPIPCLSDR
eukprot:353299-Chlamydomonas_euryale.AAC.14